MKQILKKTLTFLLVLALVNSIVDDSYGVFEVYAEIHEEEGEDCQYSSYLKDIEKSVYAFMGTNKNFSESKWENCIISSEKALFDSDNNISAYYIELMKNDKKCGDIILEANYPYSIIEYSYDDESFLEIAEEKVEEDYNIDENKQKIYYLGGMNYVVSGKNDNGKKIYVNITTSNMEKMSKKKLKYIEKENSDINVQEVSFKSRPDNSGDGFITAPGDYESGYDTYKSKNIKNYNITYKIMSQFSSGGVCAPTAATNLLFYWYNRDTKKYKSLLDTSWSNTFKLMSKYMKTSKTNGTKDANVADGYKKYISHHGFNVSAKFHSGTSKGKKIVSVINGGRPCHLILHDHYKYGEHSVLAVGYQQYIYKHWYGDTYQTYIRIVDGWTSKASRFVWGGCKGSWNYVYVELK